MKNVSPDKKLIGMGNLIEFSREIFAKIAEKWKFMNFSQDGKKNRRRREIMMNEVICDAFGGKF